MLEPTDGERMRQLLGMVFGTGFCVLMVTLGAITIFGAIRDWTWLVAPPPTWGPFVNSQGVMAKYLGRTFSRCFVAAVGVSVAAVAIYVLVGLWTQR